MMIPITTESAWRRTADVRQRTLHVVQTDRRLNPLE